MPRPDAGRPLACFARSASLGRVARAKGRRTILGIAVASDADRASGPTRRAFGLGGAALASGCARGARAVRIIVGSGAGAASDALARLAAKHLRLKFGLAITVEDEPRGGGKLAAARLAGSPPGDGVIAFLPTGLLYASLLREPGVTWDLAAFGWIGSFSSDRRVLVVSARAGATSFEQILQRRRVLVAPCTSASAPGYYETRILDHLTGARLKPVPGFPGGGRSLAFFSGEAQALIGTYDGLGGVLELPGARVVLRLNDLPLPARIQPPTLSSFARGPDAPALTGLVEAHAALGRIAALAPGSPPQAVALWRARFADLTKDQGFLAEAKAHGFMIEPTPGAAVQQRLAGLLSAGGGVRDALVRALSCGGAGCPAQDA